MKLSVVTVNLNNAAGLAKTLDSVVAQTFRDFEHIVIDGGSTDGSVELIRARSDHLAYWVSEPDNGVYAAMNKGWRAAQGEYVYFLNSGDWLAAPSAVAELLAGASEDLVYGDFLRPDGRGGTRYHRQPATMQVGRYLEWGYCHQTIFFRRTVLERLGGYDESLRIVADWELTVRALLADCTTRHRAIAVAFYDAGGLSASNMELIATERRAFLARLVPPALLRELERLRDMERENDRLLSIERWLEGLQRRNIFREIAMVVGWRIAERRRGGRAGKEGRA